MVGANSVDGEPACDWRVTARMRLTQNYLMVVFVVVLAAERKLATWRKRLNSPQLLKFGAPGHLQMLLFY